MKRSNAFSLGFSLIEVTISLGVIGFCILAIVGLLPIASRTGFDSSAQTSATQLLASLVADLYTAPKTASASPQYGIDFASATTLYVDDNGVASSFVKGTSRYRVTASPITSPGMVYMHLNVSWPAAASLGNASGSLETFSAFNRN